MRDEAMVFAMLDDMQCAEREAKSIYEEVMSSVRASMFGKISYDKADMIAEAVYRGAKSYVEKKQMQ